jgi:hypothetical protein
MEPGIRLPEIYWFAVRRSPPPAVGDGGRKYPSKSIFFVTWRSFVVAEIGMGAESERELHEFSVILTQTIEKYIL